MSPGSDFDRWPRRSAQRAVDEWSYEATRKPAWVRATDLLPWWLIGNSFEVLVSILLVVAGLSLLIGGPAPTSLDATLPGWLVTAWGSFLVVGGGSVAWGSIRAKYGVEQFGLALLVPTAMIYGACLAVFAGPAAAVPLALDVAFSLSCMFRYLLIARARRVILWHTQQRLRELRELRDLLGSVPEDSLLRDIQDRPYRRDESR